MDYDEKNNKILAKQMTARNQCAEKNKTIQNLFRYLQKDLKSIFYCFKFEKVNIK